MNNKKIKFLTLNAILSAIILSNPAFAQSNTPVFDAEQINNQMVESRLQDTNVDSPDSGNVLERSLTPLLRETSRKKSVLELKKLDLEIEKLDSETLKIQQEKLNSTNNKNENINGLNLPPGTRIIDASNLSNNPVLAQDIEPKPPVAAPATPPQMLPPVTNEVNQMKVPEYAPPVDNNAGIRVLMTYGFSDDLFAKITHGSQGGYVIRKGDILPNGKVVVKITPNYIEVRAPYTKDKEKNKKIKNQKIYVTGPGSQENMNEDRSHLIGGNQGSSNISPPTAMSGAFGDLSVPRLQEQVVNVPAPIPNTQPRLEVTPLTGK